MANSLDTTIFRQNWHCPTCGTFGFVFYGLAQDAPQALEMAKDQHATMDPDCHGKRGGDRVLLMGKATVEKWGSRRTVKHG